MQNILSFLKGKKTYACFAVVFVTGGLYAVNLIDREMFETISVMFGSLGGVALRASK